MNACPPVVLCVAGRYERFKQVGFREPKFLLPFRQTTVLEAVVRCVSECPLVVLANRRDMGAASRIREALAACQYELHFVHDTAGQAQTAAIGMRRLIEQGHSGPVLVHNADTLVYRRDAREMAAKMARMDATGIIDLFDSTLDCYSYVSVCDGLVVDIAEKRVISPLATSGLYGFRSPSHYLSHLRSSGTEKGEQYVSEVYTSMLGAGERILASTSEPGSTLVLGTPDAYFAALHLQDYEVDT